MTDFIKAHTMYAFEDYKWRLNPCLIKIMCADNTRIHYLTEEQAERRKAKVITGENIAELNDLGIPVFGNNKND